MKLKIGIILSVVGLFVPLLVPAQGTLYLSNLGRLSSGSAVVGSDAWIAQDFRTGNNPGGYTLDSIQLLMSTVSGSPSGFSASIYNTVGGLPGNSIGSLSGVSPSAGGTFSYSANNLSLSSSTLYFVVLTSATPIANGSYDWSFSNDSTYDSSDGWIMNHIYYTSADGLNWPNFGRQDFFQVSVYATTVPEPTTATLVGFGLICFSYLRCNYRRNIAR